MTCTCPEKLRQNTRPRADVARIRNAATKQKIRS
jgi:hypothetical protein